MTHSPFILSDIPSANILFLDENGAPKVDAVLSRTFGANIHDLLKNNFFLLNGAIGNFAKEKINDTINYLNHQKVLKEIDIIKGQKEQNKVLLALKIKEEKELKARLIETSLNKHRDTINLIGEPVVQIKLAEMFDEVTNDKLELNIIRQRIATLQEEEQRLLK